MMGFLSHFIDLIADMPSWYLDDALWVTELLTLLLPLSVFLFSKGLKNRV